MPFIMQPIDRQFSPYAESHDVDPSERRQINREINTITFALAGGVALYSAAAVGIIDITGLGHALDTINQHIVNSQSLH